MSYSRPTHTPTVTYKDDIRSPQAANNITVVYMWFLIRFGDTATVSMMLS